MLYEEFNTELQQWEYLHTEGDVKVCISSLNRMPLEHVLKHVQKVLGV